MFDALARLTIRFRWLIVAAWIVGAIAGVRLLPGLSDLTQSSNSQFLSASSPSVQAAGLAAPFQARNPSGTAIIVAYRASGPLTADDAAAVGRVEEAARQVPGVSLVTDAGISKDGQVAEALVTVTAAAADSSTASKTLVDGIRAGFASWLRASTPRAAPAGPSPGSRSSSWSSSCSSSTGPCRRP